MGRRLVKPNGKMSGAEQMKSFQVGNANFGDGRLTIIAGPCVIESSEHALMMARECSSRAREAGLDFVYKSSFDKANRSRAFVDSVWKRVSQFCVR